MRADICEYPASCKNDVYSVSCGGEEGPRKGVSTISSGVEGRAGGRRRFRKQTTKRRHRRIRTRTPSILPAMAPVEVWDEVVIPVDDDDDDDEPVDFEGEELELELGV